MLDEGLFDAPRAGLDDADVAVLARRDDVAVVHVEGQRVHRAVRVVQGAVLGPVPQVEDLAGLEEMVQCSLDKWSLVRNCPHVHSVSKYNNQITKRFPPSVCVSHLTKMYSRRIWGRWWRYLVGDLGSVL